MTFQEDMARVIKETPIDGPKDTGGTFTLGDIFDQGFTKGAEWGFKRAAHLLRTAELNSGAKVLGANFQFAGWLEAHVNPKGDE